MIGDIDALAKRLRTSSSIRRGRRHTPRRRRSGPPGTTERKEAARRRGGADRRPNPPSGRPPAIGCARSWTSGRPSAGVDRKVDDALWKRYSKAREAFNRRRGAHFAELDRERAAAKTAKEELCVRAEELSTPPTGSPPRRRSVNCSPSGRPQAARRATPTTPCGGGSRARRTCSSPRVTTPPPSATRSSRRTRWRRRNS